MELTLESDSSTGEMTALRGEPASVILKVSELARYQVIEAEQLCKLVKKNMEICVLFESSLARNMHDKLVRLNRFIRASGGVISRSSPGEPVKKEDSWPGVSVS